MGKKTHGPYLISAIEKNDHQKVHEILSKEIRNKEKIREICTSSLKRLASEHYEVPLLLAAQLPDPSIIQYMVGNHHVDINFVLKEQVGRKQKVKSALILAVRRGMYDTVEAILAMNADPNIQDHKGRSALHHAVRKADYRMAKMLVVRGAQASLTDKGDNTPLHVASIFGHVELAKMLIYYGADLYKKGQLGAIPIHIAAKEGHVGLLKLFCQHDVNPNIKMPCYDGREKAALHVAAEEGHYECVVALVELGADINLGDSEGETPLHCSVLHEYDPMGMKSKEDYTETSKVIIKSGSNVNNQNGRGETALHLAARNQFQKSVEVLLQAGADPLMEDNSGDKPLDLVDEEDAVSRQILKQVMENRESYMNDLFELKAKGYSTSVNPLTSKSMSMDMLSSKESILGKAASTLGLVHPYPRTSTNSMPAEDEYLQPIGSRHSLSAQNITAEIHPNASGSSDTTGEGPHKSPDNTYAKIDENQQNAKPGPDVKKGKEAMVPKFLKGKQSQESLLERKANMLESSDSSHYDDDSKNRNTPNKIPKVANGVMKIEAVKRTDSNMGRSLPSPPPSTVRDSIISTSTDMTDMSSVWEVTPHPSVSGGRGQRDFGVSKTTGDLMSKLKQSLAAREREYSEYATTQYESLPGDTTRRELKGLSTFAPDPKMQAQQPKTVQQAPITGTKIVYAPDETHSDSDDDTFFDDESFDTMDTMSEATVEMVDKQKQKVVTANKELNAKGQTAPKQGDSHVQNWLSEQATLMIKRNFAKEGGPIAQSTPPSSRVNYATNVSDLPSDVYENFTSVSEQAAMAHKTSSKHPKTGRPVPPPRPPKKLERNPSTSSADSIKRPLPPEPKPKPTKVKKKAKEVDTGVNVKLEVDDKEPGQTVIRILPVQQKPTTPKKPKLHAGADEDSRFGKLNADNISNLLVSSGSKRQSSFDTDSQVSSFSKSSSKVKRKPSQRFVIEKPGVPRTSRHEKLHNHQHNGNTFMPLSKGKHNVTEDQDSMEQESIFIDDTDDDDDEPNTGHYTAIYFEHVKQDDFDRQDETAEEIPSAPSTPKIKMTFQSKEPPMVHDVPANKPLPKKRNEMAPPVIKQLPVNEAPPVKPANKPEILKPELKPQSKPEIKPPLSTKPDIRPNIRPKPQPRNITPVLKMEETREEVKSPIPKPRVQKESTSQNTSQEALQTINHDTHSENVQEQVVKKPKSVPKNTIPEPDSKKIKSTKVSPPSQTEEEPLPNINNNIEKKITPTKKKVKKKGTKSKTSQEKKEAKTATIKIEKVEKPKVEEQKPVVEVATKPDAVHYAVVNKNAKDKSKPKPSTTEDSDTSSNSQDSKEAPPPPIKLIDPYPDSNKSTKSPTIVKLEDPYASVSVVDEVITNKFEEPLPLGTQSQSNQEYEELPAFKITPQKPPEEPITQLKESPKARKVTIGSKQFIPNNKKRPKDHDHRRIVYVCSGEIDFDIIGGNADGVFIYNLQAGSNGENAGLQIGDKLLKINEESVLGKTKEEVYLILKSIKNVLDMVVRHRYDSYKALIDSGGLGDSFHIRSHLNYKAARNGEMNISSGDLLLIQDTLPNGQYGYWRASKLNAGPREQQHGLIPNLQKAEQIGLDARMSQLKELEKERGGFLKRGFKRSKSLDRSAMKLAKSQEDLSLNARNKIAYEKVEHKAADFPRPVFLLGLFCDVIRDMLARECPGIFHIPNGDIEVPTTNASGALDPIDTTVLKNIISGGKHCLTIISPKGIEFLQNTDLNPMVIYLSPAHKSILKIVKNKLAPMYEKKIGYLYDESMAFERQYDHLFTATVSYTSDDSWFPLLKDTIHRIQNQPQWQTVKETSKPRVDSSDEESEDESQLMNRSLDNIPHQLNHSLPIMGRNNKNIQGIMKKQEDSPLSDRSVTSSVSSLPKKSILKKDRSDFSANSPQVSDTESSGSSVTKPHVNNKAPNNIGQFIAPPNQYHQPPTNQYRHAPQSNQYNQPPPNQYHEPVNQQYQPPNQYHPHPQAVNHPPTQQYQQHPPPAQRNIKKSVSESGPAMLGFHPAMSALTAQTFNPPAQTAGGHSGKETVL